MFKKVVLSVVIAMALIMSASASVTSTPIRTVVAPSFGPLPPPFPDGCTWFKPFCK